MSSAPVKVFGLIPAAGHSRRMLGRTKQILPFGDSTILQTVIDKILASDLDGLVVVTNPSVDATLHLSQDARFVTVLVDDPEAEMLESILHGMDAIAARFSSSGMSPRRLLGDLPVDTWAGSPCHDGLLVCPGDVPRMPVEIVKQCAAAYRKNPGRIVVAGAAGKFGHPIVVPFGMKAEIVSLRGIGLRGVLTNHAGDLQFVDAGDASVLDDIDTPEDYRAPTSKDMGHPA